MEESSELIEIALTVAIALAVGFTTASFGIDPTVSDSGSGAPPARVLVQKVIQALMPIGQQIIDTWPDKHLET